MPSYDYRCRQCGMTFEVRRSIAATETAATCPDGHADTVKLLLARLPGVPKKAQL